MVSLIIGLGAKLFDLLGVVGFSSEMVTATKVLLFAVSVVWSLWLANRILCRQGVRLPLRWMPMIPGALGSLAVGASWWIAIF